MTEFERMTAGLPYNPMDADLVARRRRSRQRCFRLNATDPTDRDGVAALLGDLMPDGGAAAGIELPFFVDYGENVHLGRDVYFNVNCVVLDVCPVVVGDRTKFGPAVQIYTATHPLTAKARVEYEYGRPVTVGCDVWVGGGAILCPGVTIGDRAVIGAGSVVTRDIPADVVAAGNPCRVIRAINQEEGEAAPNPH